MVTTRLKLDLYNGFLNYQILILCPQDARNQILGLNELEKKKKKSQSTLLFHNSHLLGIKTKVLNTTLCPKIIKMCLKRMFSRHSKDPTVLATWRTQFTWIHMSLLLNPNLLFTNYLNKPFHQ